MSADVAFEILTIFAITYTLFDLVRRANLRMDSGRRRYQPASDTRSSRVPHAHPIDPTQ